MVEQVPAATGNRKEELVLETLFRRLRYGSGSQTRS